MASTPAWQARTAKERQGGADLLMHLLKMYSSCRITANQFSVACHFCKEANVPGGNFDQYARPEGLQSGKYQNHLDKHLPQPRHLYFVQTPQQVNHSPLRTIQNIPVKLAYEAIQDELVADPDVWHKLQAEPHERTANVTDLPAFKLHPLVTAATAANKPRPLPVGLYVDGVAYKQQASGRSDTVAGYWLINLISGKRYLLCALRHSDDCDCGCRGWCSIFPVLSCLRWQLECMAHGLRPDRMHNGDPWPRGQGHAPADRQLSYSAVLLFVKGDWCEHSKTLGLSSWAQNDNCCQFCELSKHELHNSSHYISHDGVEQWPMREHHEYETAVRQCEVVIEIATPLQLQLVVRSLRWFKHKKMMNRTGLRSRCIFTAIVIAGISLLVGDRLEPSEELHDIAALSQVKLPASIKFWRTRTGSEGALLDSVHHRCPIFNNVLCTSPARTLAIDAMHCLHLGVIMRFVSSCLWRLLLENPWDFSGSESQIQDLALRQIWCELKSWQEKNVPCSDRLDGLTAKMMGKSCGRTTEDAFFLLYQNRSNQLPATVENQSSPWQERLENYTLVLGGDSGQGLAFGERGQHLKQTWPLATGSPWRAHEPQGSRVRAHVEVRDGRDDCPRWRGSIWGAHIGGWRCPDDIYRCHEIRA